MASLWALAGLFFIYVGFLGQRLQINYQRIDLIQNRDELELTREELKGQKEQMEEQNKMFNQQQFENFFFNQLSNIREIISYSILSSYTGSIAFDKSIYNLFSKYKQSTKDRIKYTEIIDVFKANHGNTYTPFIHSIENLIYFIDNSNFNDEIKKRYYNILGASFSFNQLFLIQVYIKSDHGKHLDKLKNIDVLLGGDVIVKFKEVSY